jgi:hypothetical protein
MAENKAVVCALSASYISTFAGYPASTVKTGPHIEMLTPPSVGFVEIEVANYENAHFGFSARRYRFSRRGDGWVFPWLMDPAYDHFIRSCVWQVDCLRRR